MSLFLGPIHHKLYFKINFLKEMDKYISSKLEEDFVSSVEDAPLEMLVSDNIHQSLQEMIRIVESEHAAFMSKLYTERYDDWKEAVIQYAKEHVIFKDYDNIISTFEEHFLHGMPCDRIVMAEVSGDTTIVTLREDEHAKYYEDIKVLEEERNLMFTNMVWSNIEVTCEPNQFVFQRRNS